MINAALGPYTTSENASARAVFDTLEPGMQLLASRGFYRFDAFQATRASAADLARRVRKSLKLPPEARFDDGSYLSCIHHQRDSNGDTAGS